MIQSKVGTRLMCVIWCWTDVKTLTDHEAMETKHKGDHLLHHMYETSRRCSLRHHGVYPRLTDEVQILLYTSLW